MKKASIFLCGLLLGACGPAAAPNRSDKADSHANPSLPAEYLELKASGERYFLAHDYEAAHADFESAADVPLFEVPNFEILLRLAEAKCYLGKNKEAGALLKDFRCMLEVDSGRKQCYVDSGPGYLGSRNADLSPECFQRMCSEMYLGLYELSGESDRARDLERDLKRVETVCSKMIK